MSGHRNELFPRVPNFHGAGPVSPAAFLALARTKLEAGARQLVSSVGSFWASLCPFRANRPLPTWQRPLKDFLERVNLPSGLKGTEKRLVRAAAPSAVKLSYYSSNYATHRSCDSLPTFRTTRPTTSSFALPP